MSAEAADPHDLPGRKNCLVVIRPPDLFLAMDGDGRVQAFCGHVDLGTGIRTALAQIVAEELDVPLDHVTLVLGDTEITPDQGATIASETIQVSARPLRQSAAGARRFLIQRAASLFGAPPESLAVADGVITIAWAAASGDNLRVSYAELVRGEHITLLLDPDVPVKPASSYRLVGTSSPRVDIPAKSTGRWVYVHDVRVPGMLHGRVVRPPYAGFDSGPHVGTSLISVDQSSIDHIPGIAAIVVIGDFVGVVAEREEQAIQAAREIRIRWKPAPRLPDLNAPETAIRASPATPRVLLDRGDVERVIAASADPMARTYLWPYQMHASIGPSCAVADWRPEGITVWSGTQNPYPLRADIARLLAMPEEKVTIRRAEAAGCYGRNCADDVSADAALLSRAAGRPVRVQLTREQEHAWEPKGAAQVMDVRGGLDAGGAPAAYDFATRYPSNGAPTLALLLTGTIPPTPAVLEMGDRTAIPPYAFDHARITVYDMPPLARASWLRGVSAMPNSFAHESYIDELAVAAGVDPIEYRLRYLEDPRAASLVRAVAEKAGWVPHTRPGTHGGEGALLYGRGFGYAVYVHGTFPGTAAAYAAWVADVAVNRETGEIAVTRVIVGQDCGLMINPDGVRHQIHGNVIQSTSRALKEQVSFDRDAVASLEWGAYPIITFPEVPEIEVLMVARPEEPPLGVGESASVPGAAAIANAVFDATSIRFRALPLTPERVRAALNPAAAAREDAGAGAKRPHRRIGALTGIFAAAMGITTVGITTSILPWRASYPPIERPQAGVYSAATIARGRLAAAAGACNACHVGNDGAAYAGGRAFETTFGTVFASNISPDARYGIGAWSYPAFARAMKEGVSRDGHYLYPVHPYPSFAKASDADIQALYAYLMTQAPAARAPPAAALKFPFSVRPLMSVWNALFLRSGRLAEDPARPAAWNRGAYLVESLGHCGACHTARNALGAEKTGAFHLAGGVADGWEAPSLTATSKAPVPWTEQSLFDYLRSGRSAHHGSAAGPMAEVVDALAPLPDSDIRAMATYLASLNPAAGMDMGQAAALAESVRAESAAARTEAAMAYPVGARLYAGACASCHDGTDLPSLALDTSLHAETADTVIRAILEGVSPPEQAPGLAIMPGFSVSIGNDQLAALAAYLRRRFAPGEPAWTDIATKTASARRSLEQRAHRMISGRQE